MLLISCSVLNAATINDKSIGLMLSSMEAQIPQTEIRVHTIGNTRLTVSNWGCWVPGLMKGILNP